MTLHTPLAMQPVTGDADVTYTAQEFRMMTRSLAAVGGQALDVQGVVAAASMNVTQRGAGANFSVDVAAGTGFVTGDDITNQGMYHCWNDATVNVVTPGAPGSGTRIHRLVLQIRDKQSNGTYTTYDAQFQLLQDTGSGTPAEPASAITLALITIAAAQASVTNANIADQRPRADPVWAYKTTTEGRASTTTLADDADLQCPGLVAGGLYDFEVFLVYDGGSGAAEGDFKFKLVFPAAPVWCTYVEYFRGAGGAFNPNGETSNVQNIGGSNGVGTFYGVVLSGTVLMGTLTGPAKIQWAQGTSMSTNTHLEQGSKMRFTRRG